MAKDSAVSPPGRMGTQSSARGWAVWFSQGSMMMTLPPFLRLSLMNRPWFPPLLATQLQPNITCSSHSRI